MDELDALDWFDDPQQLYDYCVAALCADADVEHPVISNAKHVSHLPPGTRLH